MHSSNNRKKMIRIVVVVVCLLLALNSRRILKTLYPIHYYDLIVEYAEKYDLDPYLLASIIRNESGFNPNAVSIKGASGLMQIMPLTGEWITESIGRTDYSDEMLFDPEKNISLGAWYLNFLYNKFDGDLKLVIAAYNAGNGNVRTWLRNSEYSEDGMTLNIIPFPETKTYFRRVSRDYKIYKIIYREGIKYMFSE
ncbi:MAG: lytic transglycosylase domain-containing protein [Clostridiales bacterium]|nr:lytic transglycosylase domain-containing protein [Clostridiales bacterium]